MGEERSSAEFARLLGESQSRLFGYIHSLVRDANDADDIFQQTAMVLWRKFGEYDGQGRFLRWACGVARFEAANFLRSRRRRRLYFSDELNLLLIEAQEEVPCEEVELRRSALSRCVDGLRKRDQQLLMECYSDASRVPEVAERRGRSPRSVYNSLRRIRRALYECIDRTFSRDSRPEWTT